MKKQSTDPILAMGSATPRVPATERGSGQLAPESPGVSQHMIRTCFFLCEHVFGVPTVNSRRVSPLPAVQWNLLSIPDLHG